MPVDFPASGPSPATPAAAATLAVAGPAALYWGRAQAGSISGDPAQQRAVARLQRLHEELTQRRAAARSGWRARLGFGARAAAAPKGVYLWGPVGRGKSMLMDMFFAAAPVARKRRVHFHAFMLDVHDRIERERRAATRQPVVKVAGDLAAETRLLCFDEFQVSDIADAMILERLFRTLFAAGTVVVATSNRPPQRLYEGGLQRDRFLPFIALLEERLDQVALESGRDYRLLRLIGTQMYHWPLGPAAHQALEAAFSELTEGAPTAGETLVVKRRPLVVRRAARNVAWFQFDELCRRPLAAADYLAIADRFAAIILEGIPRLEARERNEARRFQILIDALYEARTLLVASAAVPPDEIYPAGDGAWEFRRAASRLHEMQSDDYVANRDAPIAID